MVFYNDIKSGARCSLLAIFITMAFAVLLLPGCGDGGDNSDPAADISGVWNGSNSEGENISFMFVQSSSGSISGTASFLGTISGRMSNRTLSIEGSNLRGLLSSDNTTIRGSYTGTNGFAVNFAVAREGGPAPTVVETPSGGGGGSMPDGSDGGGGGSGGGGGGSTPDGGGGSDGGSGPPMPPMP